MEGPIKTMQPALDSLILQNAVDINFIYSLVDSKPLSLIYRLSLHGESAQ